MKLGDLLTPARRRRIYTILTALVPLAILYGWLDAQAAAIWLGVIAAVLGTGMARQNTEVDTPATRLAKWDARGDKFDFPEGDE